MKQEESGKIKFMSELIKNIKADLKTAMRNKEQESMTVLRLLLTAFQHKEISMRESGKAELTNEAAIEVLSAEVKKRKDSLSAFSEGDREDLASKERNALKILEKYLPEQMSDEELEKIVKQIIEELNATGPNDFGRVMGKIMPKVKGKTDGSKVSKILKDLL